MKLEGGQGEEAGSGTRPGPSLKAKERNGQSLAFCLMYLSFSVF